MFTTLHHVGDRPKSGTIAVNKFAAALFLTASTFWKPAPTDSCASEKRKNNGKETITAARLTLLNLELS